LAGGFHGKNWEWREDRVAGGEGKLKIAPNTNGEEFQTPEAKFQVKAKDKRENLKPAVKPQHASRIEARTPGNSPRLPRCALAWNLKTEPWPLPGIWLLAFGISASLTVPLQPYHPERREPQHE
jgi:hypothetical protein